ncbi:MAG: serine/threonine protein kinase, partial [Myxococcales bacterium]|nr:serine/threonine protein kinase [Myxococcales bacterium]
RLEEEIGRGGYAVVFRAWDEELGQECALKTVRPITPRPSESLARFRREANLVTKLQHPNTVRVYDYGMDEEVYIAMELLKGHPLSDELDSRRKLSVGRSVAICCEVLKSLAEAHDLGIVHRDLKPENVFLVDNGDGTESVKVLDFGIAKLTKDATHLDPVALTLQGRAMGTPNYMSPEQAKGLDLTPESDLYTVGILLWEMILGKPPFAGGTAMDIMLRHVNAPVPKLTDPELRNTPIDKAIRKALHKDLTKRFRTASEMLAALGGNAAVPVGEMTPSVSLSQDHEALGDAPISEELLVQEPEGGPNKAILAGILAAIVALIVWIVLSNI